MILFSFETEYTGRTRKQTGKGLPIVCSFWNMLIVRMLNICLMIFYLDRTPVRIFFFFFWFGLSFFFFFFFCLTKTKCSPAMRQRKKSILAMYHVTNRIRGMIYVWMDAAWISWGLAQRGRTRERERQREREQGRWGASWTAVIISTVWPDFFFFFLQQ